MGNLKQRFGNLVAAHRKSLGWTQRQLAEAAELSDDMIARIEIGGTGASFGTIERLAAALNIDAAELFSADLPSNSIHRDVSAKLATLKGVDLTWLSAVIEAALKPRR